MAQTWKCTTDTFDSELGTLSRLAVSVRLDYIKRVYGITNYLEEERLLRDLLAQFGGIPSLPTPRVMLNLAHNLNRQGRYNEAEEMALEVLSLLQEYEIYASRIVERIESLKIVSRSQFNQGQTLAAEQTMREAIRMIVDQWGIQHSWVPEFMNVLEGWLRGWGREEDANTLRGEIEELMGKDEIDE
jgi:tetratricopeptide (TPR) repeat protein